MEALSKNEKDLRDAVAVALNVKNEDVIDQLKNWVYFLIEIGICIDFGQSIEVAISKFYFYRMPKWTNMVCVS